VWQGALPEPHLRVQVLRCGGEYHLLTGEYGSFRRTDARSCSASLRARKLSSHMATSSPITSHDEHVFALPFPQVIPIELLQFLTPPGIHLLRNRKADGHKIPPLF
jgi:hypothetical protein